MGGDYITNKEYSDIKNKAIDILLGQMLNNMENTEFLSAIDSNYQNNENYISAKML